MLLNARGAFKKKTKSTKFKLQINQKWPSKIEFVLNVKSATPNTTKSTKLKLQIKLSKSSKAKWNSTSTQEMQLLKILNQQSVNQMFTMAWPKVIQPQFIR